jgi:hypothetical protein
MKSSLTFKKPDSYPEVIDKLRWAPVAPGDLVQLAKLATFGDAGHRLGYSLVIFHEASVIRRNTIWAARAFAVCLWLAAVWFVASTPPGSSLGAWAWALAILALATILGWWLCFRHKMAVVEPDEFLRTLAVWIAHECDGDAYLKELFLDGDFGDFCEQLRQNRTRSGYREWENRPDGPAASDPTSMDRIWRTVDIADGLRPANPPNGKPAA